VTDKQLACKVTVKQFSNAYVGEGLIVVRKRVLYFVDELRVWSKCRWHSYLLSSRLALFSVRFYFPAAEHHCCVASIKLYCL